MPSARTPARLVHVRNDLMETTLTVLLGLTLLAVVGVLATGLVGFIAGGAFNRKYANKLMRLRVIMQAIAVALLLILFLLKTA